MYSFQQMSARCSVLGVMVLTVAKVDVKACGLDTLEQPPLCFMTVLPFLLSLGMHLPTCNTHTQMFCTELWGPMDSSRGPVWL